MTKLFCGCCGREIKHGEWCLKCSKHLLPASTGLAMWDRTWFAQFGTDCPFQVRTIQEDRRGT